MGKIIFCNTSATGTSKESDFKSDNIIFAGYGIEDKNYNDYAGKDVKGKVVLIFTGEPMVDGKYLVTGTDKRSTWGFRVTRKAAPAKEKGAAAVLLISSSWETVPSGSWRKALLKRRCVFSAR